MTVKRYLHMTVLRKMLLMMRGRLCSLKKAGNGIFIFITTKVKITARIINVQVYTMPKQEIWTIH